jgi:hypothetical protein
MAKIVKSAILTATGSNGKECKISSMHTSAEGACFHQHAHENTQAPSFTSRGVRKYWIRSAGDRSTLNLMWSLSVVGLIFYLGGCGQDNPQPKPAAETKPALTVPEEVQSAADALLGKETTVLLVGDLARNGHQEFLAANVVPKTPKNNNIIGTIVTRTVVAENHDGKWAEILRCDEYLKNAKGYLPGTPLSGISGWRLAYDQDPEKGMALYFTPLQGSTESHQLPIGVRWNPETKRYQSLDRNYEHFLTEAPSLQNARSNLR